MEKGTVIELRGPEGPKDALTELLRTGARELLRHAVEAELEEFLLKHAHLKLENGRQRVVRNGYLPAREVQTGIGAVSVHVPRSRDKGNEGIKFTSSLIPPYLRRTKSVEEVLPWLYLKGVSTNAFSEALKSILGEDAGGLSASTISRLKASWEDENEKWQKRDLSKERYVYMWADGIHCGIRGDDERMCVLVILGVNERGEKQLVSLNDGYRESEESWLEMLRDLKDRGLQHEPQLAIADGALGFWRALPKVFPSTRQQRCWQHKTINILDKFPKSMKGKITEKLHNIWMAETKREAQKALRAFVKRYKEKYPRATECLLKDEEQLLTFYDFPAAHWRSLRTTNPIESTFATVRHRTSRAKGCVSRRSMLAFAFKLVISASRTWNRLVGFERLAEVIAGVKFINGLSEEDLKTEEISYEKEKEQDGSLAA